MDSSQSEPLAKDQAQKFDVIIVGGGLIGISLACAIVNQFKRIAIVEAVSPKSSAQPSFDDRAIALSYGSKCIFDNINCWQALRDQATAIKHIHISDQGRFGFTRLDHKQEKVDALGYVVTARDMGNALLQHLKDNQRITWFSPAKVSGIQIESDFAYCKVGMAAKTLTLQAPLLVAADGGQSSIRQYLNINAQQRDYQQTAIVTNISVNNAQENVAYERFTTSGPLALLPMSEQRYSIVWTQTSSQANDIFELPDDDFIHRLQDSFGQRVGKIVKAGKRSAYPLTLIEVSQQTQARVALIGNAAHTLHPIAGQGFNLGLRDVAALAQTITDAHRQQQDYGKAYLLQQYEQWRKADQSSIINFTDKITRTFSNDFTPLIIARNLGLIGTDLIPSVKHALSKHTMGLAGKLPRLARGLPL